MTESISSPPMTADRSRETKSPSSTARSTPTRLPKRSRSAVSRSSTSSSEALTSSTSTAMPSRSGELDLGAHVGLDGELEVLAVLERHRGDVDLGLADGADVLGFGGLGEEARERLVDGLLHDGATADTLVDDAARDLALAEARDLHLRADRAVRLVEHRLQLRERDLHDELDPGRADGLDGTLHFRHSTTMGGIGELRRMPYGPVPAGRHLPGPRARGTPDGHQCPMLPAGLGGTQSVVAGPTDSGTLGRCCRCGSRCPKGSPTTSCRCCRARPP